MFRFGVDSFIWSENFSEKDLWIIPKAKELGFCCIDLAIAHPDSFPTEQVKRKIDETGIEVVTTTTLSLETNLISPEPQVRKNGVNSLKKLIDINLSEQEWEWSVSSMREAAAYARDISDMIIAVEPVNRFETHFLNIAEDAVQYCRDVGTGNMRVHLDCFHMIREETSFTRAVKTCGKELLGYVHLCENNRGIPGTGLIPWKEFFMALQEIGYDGPTVIESFDPGFEELNGLCAIWRRFAASGEELAVKGLKNLQIIAQEAEDDGN